MTLLRAAQLPLDYNAVSILEHNLPERAEKVALLTSERELTFQQASDEVNRLGNALKRLGVRFGECVGILAPDCAEWAIAYFAMGNFDQAWQDVKEAQRLGDLIDRDFLEKLRRASGRNN